MQLTALKGAHIGATVSSDTKAAFLRKLGVDRAILYRQEDFVDAALAWSGGLAVAFDNVGAETLQHTYRAMAPYGRIVTLMGTPGDDADGSAYNKNLALHNPDAHVARPRGSSEASGRDRRGGHGVPRIG